MVEHYENPNIDLKLLERVCPEMAKIYDLYSDGIGDEEYEFVSSDTVKAIAACICKLAVKEEAAAILIGKIANDEFPDPVSAAQYFLTPPMTTRKERP